MVASGFDLIGHTRHNAGGPARPIVRRSVERRRKTQGGDWPKSMAVQGNTDDRPEPRRTRRTDYFRFEDGADVRRIRQGRTTAQVRARRGCDWQTEWSGGDSRAS